MVAHRSLIPDAEALGISAEWNVPQMPGDPTLVASHPDALQVHPKRRVAYLEHGAGQTYAGLEWHPSYSGGKGPGRDRTSLFLTLNETTARRERATYPDAQVRIVGSPRLDELARIPQRREAIAVTFHWDCPIVPETRSGFGHWRSTFANLARDVPVLGHAHPRLWAAASRWYEAHGIEPMRDFAEVVARASVLCVDNSSALFEAAALGIPVVALNCPQYRRDVHHGLRFWSDVPGPQVESPDGLLHGIVIAKTPEWRRRRLEITRRVYPSWTRGHAGRLAAEALHAWDVTVP